jgi:energy-coupling factor transport system permease protein
MVFTFGSYLPRRSILHRYDPVLKLLLLIAISIAALFIGSIYSYLILISTLILGAAVSGIGFRILIMQMKIWGWIIVLTLILHILFNPGATDFTILGIGFSYEGLYRGAFYSLRFLIFLMSAFLVTVTTTPFDLAGAFASLINPLRYLGFPVDDFAMVLVITFRFIPVIFEEAVSIKTAQEARGVDFSRGSILKPNRFIPLLIPMFYSTFRKADILSEALLSRNYMPGIRRTSISKRSLSTMDIVYFCILIILCLCLAIFF